MDNKENQNDLLKRIKIVENSVHCNDLNLGYLTQNFNNLTEKVTTMRTTMDNLSGENIDDVATNVATLSTNLNTLSTEVDNLEATVISHGNRISALEYPTYYKTSSQDFTKFFTDYVRESNKCFNLAWSEKREVGTKGSTGPFYTLVTRVDPTMQFTGTIKLQLSSLPEEKTETTLNFTINDVMTSKTVEISEETYQITIDFDFFPTKVSNIFKIAFNDTDLADTILDRIEINVTSGLNFLLLNRDNSFQFAEGKTSSRSFLNQLYQVSNTWKGEVSSTPTIANSKTINTTHVQNPENMHYVAISRNFGQRANPETFGVETGFLICYVMGEDSHMQFGYIESSYTITSDVGYRYSNVFDACPNSATREHLGQEYLMVKYDGSLTSASRNSGGSFSQTPPTFNQQEYPKEFAQFRAVQLPNINKGSTYPFYNAPYLALHRSGHVVFIPEFNSTYFIDLGIGTQPNGFMQIDGLTAHIYFTFQNNTIKRVLVKNAETGLWSLNDKIEIVEGKIQRYETNDNAYFDQERDKSASVTLIPTE